MTIAEKIKNKQSDVFSSRPLTFAFLGDSVTQGCFEIYRENTGGINVVYDSEAVYHAQIKKTLGMLYPSVPVNVINAGISGDTSWGGLNRLDRDVLSYRPDLTVVCFGLNDSGCGKEKLETYKESLREIFTRVRQAGSALIFLSPNMIGTRVHPRISDPVITELAGNMCTDEKNAFMDEYMAAAKELCAEMNVPLCDCYSLWKGLYAAGADTTALLCNDINHPSREMHKMFAYELLKMILGGQV